MDLSVERPPLLYRGSEGPPADAWDLQIAAPAPITAWLQLRQQAGRPAGLYSVGAQRAIATIATALPRTPMRSEHHFDSPRFPHPHVHVLLAAHDSDGQPLDRDQLQLIADNAWIAHVDRMVEYARERAHLGIRWTHEGIATVEHGHVPAFSCRGFSNSRHRVIVGSP